MNTPNQQYMRQIGRCSRLVSILNEENLKDVTCVLTEYMERLQKIKNRMINSDHKDLDVVTFDVYMRTIRSLLEYSDIFILSDLDRYKQSMLYLFTQFRTLAKENIPIRT